MWPIIPHPATLWTRAWKYGRKSLFALEEGGEEETERDGSNEQRKPERLSQHLVKLMSGFP